MRLAIALTSYNGDICKASVICRDILLCIFFNSLRGQYSDTLLKYQS